MLVYSLNFRYFNLKTEEEEEEEMNKNYEIHTITLKCVNMSKMLINSGTSGSISSSSSSSGSSGSNSSRSSSKILKINEHDFSINGYCPSYVCNLNLTSNSYKYGLRNDDFIIKINDINCCRATLKSIQKLINKTQTTINQQKYLVLTVYRRKQQLEQKEEEEVAIECNKIKNENKKFKFSSLFKSAIPKSCIKTEQLNSTIGSIQQQQQQLYYQLEKPIEQTSSTSTSSSSSSISIDTILETTNSYSCYDLTISEKYQPTSSSSSSSIDQKRTNLIGNLIDQEIDFVNYLSNGVSTFSRPLRGFFIRQQDYFILFQNIEKILVISENFLKSMQKWSAFDIYSHIGEFYSNKIKLLDDALKTYLNGYMVSKSLLNDLIQNSNKFRSFLKETETSELTLNTFLDMPILHFKNLINLLEKIKYSTEVNSSEYFNIENTINRKYSYLLIFFN